MKIFLDSIGCRLNQAEIERIALQFRAAGHEIVGTAENADIAVVNTCTVTRNAAADSRKVIRRATNAGIEEIIATGCWATMEPEKAAELSRHVVHNDEKENLVANYLNLKPEIFDLEPLERIPLPGYRARTRAFIKVQDGCDNECTFCITTVARGAGISRPLDEIITDIQSAVAGGAREVVLTGVHLGSWGQNFSNAPDLSLPLSKLIKSILAQTSVPRLRLSSLEPWNIEPDLFELWRDPRLMPHLHLPLQSGSDSVLRRMRRNTTREEFRALVASARAVMPNVAITTDIIAGFPDESEEEFAETLEFVREMNFAGGHIFTYSPREGTPASRMKKQLDKKTRKSRNAKLREVFTEMELNYRNKFIGEKTDVLWESSKELESGDFQMQGLTGNYLRVRATASEPRWNQVDKVSLVKIDEDVVLGEIL
ncbi:MAG: tRNA (N(6)-L-threonylcarbamoyladenosine(37)-C(2))-methylthiotransferase MtaB [Anaerolineae bacterium]|jgi:threonylcarbamoyladenosine tRNA methylthiotransferase MtaB|nr:tRNA (N(6)-L-threonylcarbamoyladenosine(37)-C(2))-methylthiotransferase MtaB [Anaerolineae bacterium]MBT4310382.1 tRNA (N(6)-L-threonylcarbamoyladenosine(37)-C(2))-methylthiotransferase MtaB [Anaerolineae bacterium]MBT4458898.1 tRNA (N(6)-L-threonylcarbamoyladenosine(37)-C(2))-methylthiotransferase MtaB [Anaerolineae bacterium]MBT4842376.1 tRNA (N(6)-L-threonylcarbamoyladenosine(37)-C(2))-methylthiotransferase MtaB [Anaerolineae bacterium]MBT6062154.1 tRNA (N(6)-L-threonylcarbamoyladenosine(